MQEKRLENTFEHWERLASDPMLNDLSTLGGTSNGRRFIDLGHLEQMLSADLAGLCVLDAGAGYGRFAVSMAKKCEMIVAIDLSPSMIRRLRKNAETNGVKRHINVVRADIRFLPFRQGCFDGIVCFGTFYYLPKQYWYNTLQAFSEALTPEGWLLISVKYVRNAFRARFGFGLLYLVAYMVLRLESICSFFTILSRRFGLHGRTEYLVTKKGAMKILATFFSWISAKGSPYATYVCKRPILRKTWQINLRFSAGHMN